VKIYTYQLWKSLIKKQTQKGEIPHLFKNKNIEPDWNDIEEKIRKHINMTGPIALSNKKAESLAHYIQRFNKPKENDPVCKFAVVLYSDTDNTIKGDLVDVSFITHPVTEYKPVLSHFCLRRLPFLKVDSQGFHLRLNESTSKATYSGKKTKVIPLG